MVTKTYIEQKADQEQDITRWFKDHKATFTKIKAGWRDRHRHDMTVLDWQEPGTSVYYIRYVFDGCNMYVSGDLGHAVFRFTQKAIPERIAGYSLSYFYEKMTAYSDSREDFNKTKALEYVDELILDYENDEQEFDREAYDEFRRIIDDCTTMREYHYHLASFDYHRLGNDSWEWISNVGVCTPLRVRAYLIGLQMATGK